MAVIKTIFKYLTALVFFYIIILSIHAFAESAPAIPADPFKIPDATKLLDLLQVIAFVVLIFLGAITIVATYVGKLAKLLADYTDTKLDDENADKIVEFANRLSKFTLGILHIFPTLGKNPTTKALEEKLVELKAEKNEQA